jgi:histidine triad (HIT) family protein
MPPVCLFCDVATKNAPASIVFEDEHVCAFLDIKPLFFGHTLVVPKQHIVTLPELPAKDVAPLFNVVQRLSLAVPKAMGAQGSFVAMNNTVSQSVAHLHVHVVPRTKGDGLKGFFWPRTKYRSDAEREAVRAKIAAAS